MNLHKNQIEFPKYDLYTKEILPYKSKEFYFNNSYCNRRNLISHFKTLNSNEIIEITKDILKKRIELKNLKYALSTVELKSLILPSILLLEHYNIDYNKICQELNLQSKYIYHNIKLKDVKLTNKIIIDTREQKPLVFPNKVKIERLCLKVGDYSTSQEIDNKLVIERKGLSDFIGTISKGWERFHKELNRAEEKRTNVLVMVESDFNQTLSFNYLPHIHSKATPEFIFSRVRELMQNYNNLQFVFVKNRLDASTLARWAISYGNDLFKYDVQFLLEKKLIL